MTSLFYLLKSGLQYFSEFFIIILELMGVIMLVSGCIYTFFHFFSPRGRDFSVKLRIKLGRFTSLALEFFLASEILKTIHVRDLSELYIIAAIIILRILIAFVVHWEMGADFNELRKNVIKRHSNN